MMEEKITLEINNLRLELGTEIQKIYEKLMELDTGLKKLKDKKIKTK
jgi:hypothetical protein